MVGRKIMEEQQRNLAEARRILNNMCQIYRQEQVDDDYPFHVFQNIPCNYNTRLTIFLVIFCDAEARTLPHASTKILKAFNRRSQWRVINESVLKCCKRNKELAYFDHIIRKGKYRFLMKK